MAFGSPEFADPADSDVSSFRAWEEAGRRGPVDEMEPIEDGAVSTIDFRLHAPVLRRIMDLICNSTDPSLVFVAAVVIGGGMKGAAGSRLTDEDIALRIGTYGRAVVNKSKRTIEKALRTRIDTQNTKTDTARKECTHSRELKLLPKSPKKFGGVTGI